MHSAIYTGTIRHRRFAPAEHSFSYGVFMMYLDLAELPNVFDGRWLWSVERANAATFRRSDHMRCDPDTPLDAAVRSLVERESGRRPSGPIRLLTHLSYFGYGFNPVSFYYCFDPAGLRLETIVAEVNNTPWGEQHCYVLDASREEGVPNIQSAQVRDVPKLRRVELWGDGNSKRYRFSKKFHVSPFMEMELDYDWRFGTPGATLAAHLESSKKGEGFFDATLTLERRPIDGRQSALALVRYPLMTVRVITAIHYQALRLWLKRVPVVTHPKKLARGASGAAS